jgi:hypothetical protein
VEVGRLAVGHIIIEIDRGKYPLPLPLMHDAPYALINYGGSQPREGAWQTTVSSDKYWPMPTRTASTTAP